MAEAKQRKDESTGQDWRDKPVEQEGENDVKKGGPAGARTEREQQERK